MIQNARIVPNTADYHADKFPRGDVRFVVSYSMLKEFGRCPSRWRDGYVPPDSDSKDKGLLVDCLLLTPKEFDNRFKFPPQEYINSKKQTAKWTWKSTTCTAWRDEQRSNGWKVVDEDDVSEAKSAISKLMSDPVLGPFIQCCKTQIQIEAEWKDDATGLVIPMRSMIDLVPDRDSEFGLSLADMKHVRCAGGRSFDNQVFQMLWHMQGAIYTDVFNAAAGETRDRWCWVVQESFDPWQCGRQLADPSFIDIGRTIYKRLLASYAQCLVTRDWPGYYGEQVQGWTVVYPKPWMIHELPPAAGPSVDDLREAEMETDHQEAEAELIP